MAGEGDFAFWCEYVNGEGVELVGVIAVFWMLVQEDCFGEIELDGYFLLGALCEGGSVFCWDEDDGQWISQESSFGEHVYHGIF